MAEKKSTKDILAALRGEAAARKGEAGGPARPADDPAEKSPPADTAADAADVKAEAANGDRAADAPATPAPTPKKTGAAPKSTKDILARLRQEGSAGKPAPKAAVPGSGDKPATATKAARTKPPVAAASGAKPSVQEMLRAVREGKPPEAATSAAPAVKKPAAPRKPQKPAAKAAAAEDGTRRNFLVALASSPFALAWTMFTASSAWFGLYLARFMMPNVLVEPPSRFKAGPPTDFPPGTVSEKFKAQHGVWLVNASYGGRNLIYALSTVCTHLGCTPNWLEGEQKFKCPCHGSGFYITGVNFEGPAPRPLERHGITLAPDGMLEVDKSMKFQEEMGQWDDPNSFVELA